jgi:hypothetical protein
MRTLKQQLSDRLHQLDRRGRSRHEAKQKELQGKQFGQGVVGIYSHNTMTNYRQVGREFISWAKTACGVKDRTPLDSLLPLAQVYVTERYAKGYSGPTVKRDVSALNKIFGLSEKPVGEKIAVPEGVSTARSLITRGRQPTDYSKRFNREKNHRLVTISRGFGLRRCEAEKARLSWIRPGSKNGLLIIDIPKNIGKGGRPRTAICDPEMAPAVRDVLREFHDMRTDHDAALFPKISKHYNEHADRAAYAQGMVGQLTGNPGLRAEMMAYAGYPQRNESRVRKGIRVYIKSDMYHAKDGSGRVYERDALYIVSQSLGHNRLEVIVKSYL